jgi:hypothetical protein
MNTEIDQFLRDGQIRKTEMDKTAANRQQAEIKKQQRKAEAEAKAEAEKQAAAEKLKQAQLRIGLYERQPVDPNNPNTAMTVVEGHKTAVSRRADNLVEVHKTKDKEGITSFNVRYLGEEFGGPRVLLQTASQEMAMNLAQSYNPYTGWRDAVMNLIDNIDPTTFPDTGPWPSKDGGMTTDPKQVRSIADMLKDREQQFAEAITRIRASGTYGVIDLGTEVLVVPKKSLRDKKGNLDMSQSVRLSRRMLFQVQQFAQQGEAAQAARQAANARPPAPRIDPATGRPPAPNAQPAPRQPAPGQPPMPPVQEFTNDRVNNILNTARNTQAIGKAEAITGVVKIMTNKDNMKIMYMKDGTIRVYGVNNNLLAVTKDEETAFSWLTK